MRAAVLIGATLLASGAVAHAAGFAGHVSGRAASVATGRGSAHGTGYAPARSYGGGHFASGRFMGFGGAPGSGWGFQHGGAGGRGYGANSYGRGYGRVDRRRGGYGYGSGLGYGLGLYAGYGFADDLATDAGGYDYEGSPQPYGEPGYDYAAPPYLAPTGYGPGYGPGYAPGPGAPALADGVHVSGEGAYAYGYNGFAETPVLPYGVPEETGPYIQTGDAQFQEGAYPGFRDTRRWMVPACGC